MLPSWLENHTHYCVVDCQNGNCQRDSAGVCLLQGVNETGNIVIRVEDNRKMEMSDKYVKKKKRDKTNVQV